MNQIATTESIALLIDADNAPSAKIDFIIAELAKTGVVNIRRAYGKSAANGPQTAAFGLDRFLARTE